MGDIVKVYRLVDGSFVIAEIKEEDKEGGVVSVCNVCVLVPDFNTKRMGFLPFNVFGVKRKGLLNLKNVVCEFEPDEVLLSSYMEYLHTIGEKLIVIPSNKGASKIIDFSKIKKE